MWARNPVNNLSIRPTKLYDQKLKKINKQKQETEPKKQSTDH